MASTTDVRAWAKAKGLEVGDKGRISPAVLEEYAAAHTDPAGAELEAELDGQTVTAGDLPEVPPAGPRPAEPEQAEQRPRRPPRPGAASGGGLAGIFRRRPAKPAPPKSHKKKTTVPRISLAGLIEDLWADMAWAAGPLPPMQKLLYAQAPMAGVAMDGAVKGTFLDRALQPVARGQARATAVGGLVCPPAALMLVLATAPAPQLDPDTGMPVSWPEPSTEHKAALLMLRWSLMLMAKAGQAQLDEYVMRAAEAAERGRQADAFMAFILGAPEQDAGESAEEQAIRQATVMFGAAPGPAANGDGPP